MRPDENFRKYFPEVEQPEEKTVSCRSSCLKTGTYMIIDKAAKYLKLEKIEMTRQLDKVHWLDHAATKTHRSSGQKNRKTSGKSN